MRGFRRAGRRTNLALLLFLAAALGTGALSYGTGTPGPARLVTFAHGAAGLGILLLAPWKRAVATRGLRRPRSHAAGLWLAGLVFLSILAGTTHAVAGYRPVLGVTALQVHVATALLAVPVALLHLWVRPQRPRRTDLSRRTALRAGLVVGGAAVAAAGLDGASRVFGLRGGRQATGSDQVGSGDPHAMPVTSWLDDAVPPRGSRPATVQVVTGGQARRVDVDGLGHGRQVRAVLDCTGGWWASQVWQGHRLDRVLAAVLDGEGASRSRSVLVVSSTGYARRFPLGDAPHLWLATHAGGLPLSAGHGAPLRLVAPGRRGFWWVKWVARVEVSETPWWWQPPFPLT